MLLPVSASPCVSLQEALGPVLPALFDTRELNHICNWQMKLDNAMDMARERGIPSAVEVIIWIRNFYEHPDRLKRALLTEPLKEFLLMEVKAPVTNR